MYQKEEIEVSKQAVIRGEEREKARGRITIAQVDGEGTVGFFTRLFNGGKYAGEVYVLSGKHRIVARIDYPYLNTYTYAWGYLWLVVEPEKTYIIKSRLEGYNVKVWLENELSGQKVGGIIGSGDEPK